MMRRTANGFRIEASSGQIPRWYTGTKTPRAARVRAAGRPFYRADARMQRDKSGARIDEHASEVEQFRVISLAETNMAPSGDAGT
jgi:hypothetical protein